MKSLHCDMRLSICTSRRLMCALIMFFGGTIGYAQAIDRIEYFFDTDPGFGNGISFPVPSPGATVSITDDISTSALNPGYHVMFIRSHSSDGNWSLAAPREFTIEAPIIVAEYFFDEDPGVGNGFPLVAAVGQTSVTTNLSLAGVPDGAHIMFLRTRQNGKWSMAAPLHFAIRARIVEAEYFIDADPGFGNGTPLTIGTPSELITLTTDVTTGALSVGMHFIFVRTKDIRGNWSLIEAQEFEVSNIVPIELLELKARVTEERNVHLTWATLTEIENDFFVVEHSTDGKTFSEIAKVAGAGDSHMPKHYSQVHATPVTGYNYYRLKQVDFDRKFSFSEVVAAKVTSVAKNEPAIYPNPATDHWFIDLSQTDFRENRLIEMFDVRGTKVLSLTSANQQHIRVQRPDISSGVFFVSITSASGVKVLKLICR